MRTYPLKLAVPNRLVYSVHNYWWETPLAQSSYPDGSYASFSAYLDSNWGFVLTEGQPFTAPVWLGEFGVGGNLDPKIENLAAIRWWPMALRYIQERKIGWAYWSVDGLQNYNVTAQATQLGMPEYYGLLTPDYAGINQPLVLMHLQGLMYGVANWNGRRS